MYLSLRLGLALGLPGHSIDDASSFECSLKFCEIEADFLNYLGWHREPGASMQYHRPLPDHDTMKL